MNERIGVMIRRGMIRLYEGGVKRRPVFRYWRELEASQWWPSDRVEALRFQRLQALLLHAQATSPWYRDTWRVGGLDARRVSAPEDFLRWPVIDRNTVRAHRMAMRTTAPGIRLIQKATGGSSGVPLSFDLDADSNDRRTAAWHRGYGWAKGAPGTRQWHLWGTLPPASTGDWRKRKIRLHEMLYGRTTASSFELGESTLDRFLTSLRRTAPDIIVAYTNALYSFAKLLDQRGLTPPAPRTVIVGAEKLHRFQRETIERVFRAPVFETYGSREFMLMAAECDCHDGLHVTMENLWIELVDDGGRPTKPGEEGNVVVTDLTNYGMPFIRYANGDRAIQEGGLCRCGRGLQRLREVVGRRVDTLFTPDGRQLSGVFFPHVMKELASVRRFQVIQEVVDAITIRIVAPEWRDTDATWLRREINASAGPTLRVIIDIVDEIPLTTAGKLQVVVNRLAMGQQPKEPG